MRAFPATKTLRTRWLALSSLLVGLLSVIACSTDSGQPPGGSNPVTCQAPNQLCGGVCRSVSSDAANCGACGAACTAGHTCQAGRCTLSCTAPNVDCGGLCANTSSNALHCGACNRPCAGGQICQAGACVTGSCPSGQSLCNGACVTTATDAMNCGACASACVVGQSCQGGVCVTPGTGGSGGAGGASTGGSAGTVASGGATTGGTAGTIGGSAGTESAGGAGAGGSAGTSTAGTAGASAAGGGGSAGTPASGGAGQGGTPATGGGGAGPGVMQSASCPNITWPTANGSRNLGGGITLGAGQTHDGGMQVHEGSLEDCGSGDQDSVDPLIEVANGGTVKNVIMGRRVGDGIHCLGSCTIENVWFPNVCDDAITILGSGTVTIKNSGFKNARDKTIQHNGTATVNIENVYVETAGKLYRSCGDGCDGSSRTANLTNIVAIGVDQVAGVSTNDTVTLKNICVHRTFSICSIYEPGSSDEVETGVNSSNEGPNANCKFTGADTHALLGKVSGIPFTTDSVCGGPNGYKSGSTATTCVAGFNKCLKACMPGGYGFKEISCGTNNRYTEGTGAICAFPTDPTAAMNLAQSRVMGATQEVDNNDECSTQWAVGIEASNNANYCVCVYKPGYYSNPNWMAWDCQRKWW